MPSSARARPPSHQATARPRMRGERNFIEGQNLLGRTEIASRKRRAAPRVGPAVIGGGAGFPQDAGLRSARRLEASVLKSSRSTCRVARRHDMAEIIKRSGGVSAKLRHPMKSTPTPLPVTAFELK